MIHCNLAVLLAERNLKIKKISDDTGISRTTLTALSNNYSQGVQFNTLNTLCIYLDVTPNDLMLFYPLDFVNKEILKVSNTHHFVLKMDILKKHLKYPIMIAGKLSRQGMFCTDFKKKNAFTTAYDMCFLPKDENQFFENNIIMKETITNIPKPFLIDFENGLEDAIKNIVFQDSSPTHSIEFNWIL